MGRLPKIRVSYYHDAQYMMRLIHAIERDPNRPNDWKQKVMGSLQELATEFLNAPSPATVKGKRA